MAKRKSTSYMTPGEQIVGTVFFVIYLVVLPFATAPLFRIGGAAAGCQHFALACKMPIYYYTLFAVTLIIFTAFWAHPEFCGQFGTPTSRS